MKHFAVIVAFSVMYIVACSNEAVETNQNVKEKIAGDSATITIDIFAKKACGATVPTIELVKDIIDRMDVTSKLNIMLVNSHSRAVELKVIGSPTIRVNGVDIDPTAVGIQKYGIT
ncbi:hypothetical protein N9903_01505 [bacterium]|nr:hypothetical protein [bacterium]